MRLTAREDVGGVRQIDLRLEKKSLRLTGPGLFEAVLRLSETARILEEILTRSLSKDLPKGLNKAPGSG